MPPASLKPHTLGGDDPRPLRACAPFAPALRWSRPTRILAGRAERTARLRESTRVIHRDIFGDVYDGCAGAIALLEDHVRALTPFRLWACRRATTELAGVRVNERAGELRESAPPASIRAFSSACCRLQGRSCAASGRAFAGRRERCRKETAWPGIVCSSPRQPIAVARRHRALLWAPPIGAPMTYAPRIARHQARRLVNRHGRRVRFKSDADDHPFTSSRQCTNAVASAPTLAILPPSGSMKNRRNSVGARL
jgi:hypothetical protein